MTKMLGNGRIETQGFDGEKRIAQIRGKMRKKVNHFIQTLEHLFAGGFNGVCDSRCVLLLLPTG